VIGVCSSVPGLSAEARLFDELAERPPAAAEVPAPPLTVSVWDALWHRIILPLRPKSWRYTAAFLAVGVVLAAAPWHLLRHPFGARAAAAAPGWRAAPRDWVAVAAAVESPAGFRPFEPVLEEVTGAAPLTWHRVAFHPAPRGSAGEVGSYSSRRIDLYGTAPYDRKDHTYMCPEARVCGEVDLCRGGEGPGRTDWLRGRNVARWVHEQGHYYEGFPRGWLRDPERQWVSETAATALVFAFAEHLGRDLSPVLAANLLLAQLVPVEGNTRFELSPSSRRDVLRALDDLPEDDAVIERLAAASVLILRSSGFASFRDVWRYAHERPAAEVAGRIRRHAARLAEGFQLTVDLALQLHGQRPPHLSSASPPPLPDPTALGPLVGLSREECLELWYQHHVITLCGRGRSARVDVTTVESHRLVARMATQARDFCLLTVNPAGAPGTAVVHEDGQTSLRATTAMADPCACRSVATPLPGPAGARVLGPAVAGLQALVQRALADVDATGGVLERAYARDAVARLAAGLPAQP
jgi:hypothetical protein